MEDVHGVMDAAGSERAALWASPRAGRCACCSPRSTPSAASALVFVGVVRPRVLTAPDQSRHPPRSGRSDHRDVRGAVGHRQASAAFFPSVAGDPEMTKLLRPVRAERRQPGGHEKAITDMAAAIDLRSVLPSITVPTLVVHHAGDPIIAVELGRYLGPHIPGAQLRGASRRRPRGARRGRIGCVVATSART